MKRAKTIALVAGLGFILLAILVQGVLPYLMEETAITSVTRTVRTPLGLLEDIEASVEPYPALVTRGRELYIREGCWYCHSQYLRPVTGEERRWGPVSEFGEYVFEKPHLFGTRRIGPDLTRVGGKYGDDWHSAHFLDPRMVVPDSVMPRFTWFHRKDGDRFVLNEDGKAIVAYVQHIGMTRGKWRDAFAYQIAESGSASIAGKESLRHGKEVYLRRCAGCHGEKGDGQGGAPMTVEFAEAQPRDFTTAVYKFRSTPTGALPTDADLYRTITVGIRGTAMPPWFVLSEAERWDVIHYIKNFSGDFEIEFLHAPPIQIPRPPEPSQAMLEQGRKVFDDLKCWECHGREGRGDGPKADELKDDFGRPIQPANFTTGVFKSGPRVQDVFRTTMTGLNGTPMPSYLDSFQGNSEAWALSYYILSLSADEK